MPEIVQTQHIDISPERYLKACTVAELIELDLLLCSPRYRNQMNGFEETNATVMLPELLPGGVNNG